MIALLQRVARAHVEVAEQTVGAIGPGMLALCAVERGDGAAQADRLLERILNYRMFADAAGKMNLNLRQIEGGLLLVSQFTLAADTTSGNRPSFTKAAAPDEGRRWFDHLLANARCAHPNVATGVFGADMQIHLINDGPVSFWLKA